MEFVKIQDYNNYSINNLGDVRVDKTGKFLKKCIEKNGYYRVSLYKNNNSKHFTIHRLVGIHFIPNPDNKPWIDHIDNNKLNNSIDNLRWASIQENQQNKSKQKNTSSIYKGVYFNKGMNKWLSSIKINKKGIHLGYFNTEKEGAEKYNEYLIEKNLTEFFNLNVIL
jgi:hypothetical protein